MTIQSEPGAHADLVGGSETTLHSHAGGSADLKPWCAIDNAGNQAITTDTHLNLNSVQHANSGYTLASNEIEINQDGDYLIMYSICYDITNTSGSTRGCVDGWLEEDSGGYAAVPGSYSRVYHREAAGGSGLSGQAIISLSDGDKVRLMATRAIYTTNLDTVANQVSVSILKVG